MPPFPHPIMAQHPPWLSSYLGVKVELLTVAHKALHDLPCHLQVLISLLSLELTQLHTDLLSVS